METIKKCRRCRKTKEYSCLKYCEKCRRIIEVEYRKKERETRQKYSKENGKEYRQRPEVIQRRKDYYQDNKEKIIRYINEYIKQRIRTDKEYYLTHKLRNQVRKALMNYSKTGKIMSSKEYCIDYKAIIEHLKPFPENIRDYDIHHIKQLVTFNFINEDGSTNLKEVRKAFTPENLILLTKEQHKKIHKTCSRKKPIII